MDHPTSSSSTNNNNPKEEETSNNTCTQTTTTTTTPTKEEEEEEAKNNSPPTEEDNNNLVNHICETTVTAAVDEGAAATTTTAAPFRRARTKMTPRSKTKWEQSYADLKRYRRRFGHCAVPAYQKAKFDSSPELTEWAKLSKWVSNQRTQYRLFTSGNAHDSARSQMSQERIDALEKIGFQWSGSVAKRSLSSTGHAETAPLPDISSSSSDEEAEMEGAEGEEGAVEPPHTLQYAVPMYIQTQNNSTAVPGNNNGPQVIPMANAVSATLDREQMQQLEEVIDMNRRFNSKIRWTKEEDEVLVKQYHTLGPKWMDIATSLPGRKGKHCRERWVNHLDPQLKKGAWDPEEDMTVLIFHYYHGNKWKLIADEIAGRPENDVRNHWRTVKFSADYLNDGRYDKICHAVQSYSIEMSSNIPKLMKNQETKAKMFEIVRKIVQSENEVDEKAKEEFEKQVMRRRVEARNATEITALAVDPEAMAEVVAEAVSTVITGGGDDSAEVAAESTSNEAAPTTSTHSQVENMKSDV